MKTQFRCTAFLAGLILLAGPRIFAAASDNPANPPAAKDATTDASATTQSQGKPGPAVDAAAPADKSVPDPNSYANKETYPHSTSSDVSPTALISGGNAGGGGGSPVEVAASVVEGRIKEWHLSPAEVQAHLDRGEAIVRTREAGANAPTGPVTDDALHTLINARLVADIDTVRVTSQQDVRNGEVTLRGKVHSAELLGRAMAITLDTPGVTKVTSEMTIDPLEPGPQRDDASRIPAAGKSAADK